jgi:hypothetical protein
MGEMMTNRDTLKAIMRTLAASVNSGLNASLTPADCKALLLYIASTKPKGNGWGAVFDIVQRFAGDYLEEVADQFRKGKL